MENSSVANYWWNFYGRFNAAYLRSQRSFVSIALPFQEWRKKGEGSDERKIKKRREKLAWDLVEISCPDICMWSLTTGFTEKKRGSRETKENAKVGLSTFHFLFLRVLLNLSPLFEIGKETVKLIKYDNPFSIVFVIISIKM